MKKSRSFKAWLKLVVFFPCLFVLGMGSDAATIEAAAGAERLAAEEAERERLAAEAAAAAELEDRGDDFKPAPDTDTDAALDAEALAAIAATAEEAEGKDKTPPKYVPYDRFSEKVALAKGLEESRDRERAERERLEAELQALKGTAAATADTTAKPADTLQAARTELRDLRKEYRTAMADAALDPADEEVAAKLEELEEKLSTAEDKIIELRTLSTIDTRTAQEMAQTTLQTVINQAHADFPFLDPKSPDANADLNDDIIAYRDGKVAQGIPVAQALQLAVNKFAPAYAKEKGITLPGATTDKGDDIAAKRLLLEKEARERNAAASVAQPAAIAHAGSGARSTETLMGNIANVDEKTFDSIPDAELRKQRGD